MRESYYKIYIVILAYNFFVILKEKKLRKKKL